MEGASMLIFSHSNFRRNMLYIIGSEIAIMHYLGGFQGLTAVLLRKKNI